MEVKLVPNADFMQLSELTVKMYHAIDSTINEFQAVNTLVSFINNSVNFMAFGLYDEDVLIGFTFGYAVSDKKFYFAGIYCPISSEVSNLITSSLDAIKAAGYVAWEAEATNDNIGSVLEKFGASKRTVKYIGEFNG